jgi:hypothetical protein
MSEHREFSALIGFPSAKLPPGVCFSYWFNSLESYTFTDWTGRVTSLPKSASSARLQQSQGSCWDKFSIDKSMFPSTAPEPGENHYFQVLSVVSQTGDVIKMGCNILFESKVLNLPCIDSCSVISN